MAKRNGRWWLSLGSGWKRGKDGFVPFLGSESITGIPEPIARLVYEEYHYDQTFERLHERGGFSAAECIAALADIIERERGARKVDGRD